MDKNRNLRAMTQSLIPRYNHSFYICIPYLKILACSSGENCDTSLDSKDKKWIYKGKNKSKEPILHPSIHQLIVHVYTKFQHSSFKSSWENSNRIF